MLGILSRKIACVPEGIFSCFNFSIICGIVICSRGLAQLVARALWEREVSSSSLLTPTI